ncbi:MAG: arylsulfotransferase family protein [Acidobacteriota bacterium]|nr:arylsulfotransferase family protein [Acidobacteriota bacterium]
MVLCLALLLLVSLALKARTLSTLLGLAFLAALGTRIWKRGRAGRIAVGISASLLAAAGLLSLVLRPHPPVPGRAGAGRTAITASLESLPYLAHVDHAAEKTDGVLAFDPETAWPGLNLYNSYYKPGAYLLDMAGRTLHTWRPPESGSRWQYVAVCGDGDLLVLVEDSCLMRLNWDSRVLWRRDMRAHHEIAVAENGDIYTLISREEVVLIGPVPVPIIDDVLVVLSPEGVVRRRISLANVLAGELSGWNALAVYSRIINPQDLFWKTIRDRRTRPFLLPRATSFDPFHANSIEIFDRDVPELGRKGDVLISLRSLDLVAVVDMETEKEIWSWGPGSLQEQHRPTLLDNGNLLVFDNGTKRKYSRLIELEPRAKSIVWEYKGGDSDPFYSNWGGTAQRLENGNTLVTETSGGRVFEVTREGRTVWDFYNPDLQDDGRRASIYRMTRITAPPLQASLMKRVERDLREAGGK